MGFLKSIGVGRRQKSLMFDRAVTNLNDKTTKGPSEGNLKGVSTDDLWEALLDRLGSNSEDEKGLLSHMHPNKSKNEMRQSATREKAINPMQMEDDALSFFEAYECIMHDDINSIDESDEESDNDEDEDQEEQCEENRNDEERDDEEECDENSIQSSSLCHHEEQSTSETSSAPPFTSAYLNRIAKKFDIQVTEKSRTGPEDKCITNPLGYLEDLKQFENMGNALNCLEDLRRFESTVLSNFEDSRIIEKPCNCDEDVEIEITALTGKELLADNCAVGDVRPAEQLPLVVKNNDRRNVLAWSRCAARNRSNGPSAFPISHPGALGPSGSLPDGRNVLAWSRCAARNRSNGPSAFPISHPGALGPSGSLPDGRFYAW